MLFVFLQPINKNKFRTTKCSEKNYFQFLQTISLCGHFNYANLFVCQSPSFIELQKYLLNYYLAKPTRRKMNCDPKQLHTQQKINLNPNCLYPFSLFAVHHCLYLSLHGKLQQTFFRANAKRTLADFLGPSSICLEKQA